MEKKTKRRLFLAIGFLSAFAVFTVLVCTVGRAPIGPMGTSVGFAALNNAGKEIFAFHPGLYGLTDLFGLVPILFALGFAALGLWQWIRRGSLLRVDRSLLILGVFYAAVAGAFVLFEVLSLNYRPVLIDGRLEASYPSSTTLLTLCVMPTAVMQLRARIQNPALRRTLALLITAFSLLTVALRICAGVHWLTDIIGGVLLSAGLVFLYAFAAEPKG